MAQNRILESWAPTDWATSHLQNWHFCRGNRVSTFSRLLVLHLRLRSCVPTSFATTTRQGHERQSCVNAAFARLALASRQLGRAIGYFSLPRSCSALQALTRSPFSCSSIAHLSTSAHSSTRHVHASPQVTPPQCSHTRRRSSAAQSTPKHAALQKPQLKKMSSFHAVYLLLSLKQRASGGSVGATYIG